MRINWVQLFGILALFMPFQMAHAATNWPEALREQLLRINTVEWRLRQAANPSCPAHSAGFGWAIDHLGAYAESDRSFVQASTGLGYLPQIIAIADGSPAQLADFHVSDEIQSINGVPLDQIFPDLENGSLIADRFVSLTEKLPVGVPSQFGIIRNGQHHTISVSPISTCAARIYLKIKNGIDAYSDADGIALSTGFMQFTRNDDEVALIAGHELAHIVLRDELSRNNIRGKDKEDAADKLGAHLALCAGYNPTIALDYWRRFDKQDWIGMFRSWDHRSSKSRLKMLQKFTSSDTC
ncbi:hypothetical protein GRI39_02890 [Altererythrobacter indicus]|uniref:Peptidase M48 domain-containing protein n=1 Tax=Altericroceibacterium indicum TaxID=374177 RepID=A0A845A5J9_9SPHN|nr:M48 family metalloprotease [Altericroceibacterium indicum]MXP24994.1 hypothetical protein [Altericroceibacterium indicum]